MGDPINSDESLMYLSKQVSESDWNKTLDQTFGDAAGVIRKLLEEKPLRARLDLVNNESNYLCPSLLLADAHEKIYSNTYVYEFAAIRDGTTIGAYHGAEIPYVFDRHDDWMPTTVNDELCSRILP